MSDIISATEMMRQITLSNKLIAEIIQEERAENKRAADWAMIRPISEIKQEVFPQRVQVHHATTNYGGSIDKDGRD